MYIDSTYVHVRVYAHVRSLAQGHEKSKVPFSCSALQTRLHSTFKSTAARHQFYLHVQCISCQAASDVTFVPALGDATAADVFDYPLPGGDDAFSVQEAVLTWMKPILSHMMQSVIAVYD